MDGLWTCKVTGCVSGETDTLSGIKMVAKCKAVTPMPQVTLNEIRFSALSLLPTVSTMWTADWGFSSDSERERERERESLCLIV